MSHDLISRAAWTFVQGALGYLAVTPERNWKALLAGAIGAGLSAGKTAWLARRDDIPTTSCLTCGADQPE